MNNQLNKFLTLSLLLCSTIIPLELFAKVMPPIGEAKLPGLFFPESIASDTSGNLYTSSLATGEIGKISGIDRSYRTFVTAGVNINSTGLLVDSKRKVLWSCAVDLTMATPSQLRAFSLVTGSIISKYPIPNGGLCADIDMNTNGDLYITDTFLSRILRLKTPDTFSPIAGNLTIWSADTLLNQAPDSFLKVNGIAVQGTGAEKGIFTTNYSTGQLFRIPIQNDGSAGRPIEIILDTNLVTPDGLRRLANNQLMVALNIGVIAKITVTGNRGKVTVVNDTLDQPSSLIVTGVYTNLLGGGGVAWVSEGQILRFVGADPSPVNQPFKLKQINF